MKRLAAPLPAYPVPCVRLARLAVARDAQGLGIGRLLLGHAMNCGVAMRANAGAGLLVVDAMDARAAGFYRLHGFRESADNRARQCSPPTSASDEVGAAE